MNTNQILEILELLTDKKIVVVKNNKAKFYASGKAIPLAHLMYQKIPEGGDGNYFASAATCGDASGCFVGNYKKDCNAYSPRKCAVYSLTPITDYRLHIDPIKFIDFLTNIES